MTSWDVQLPPSFSLDVNGTRIQDDVGRMVKSIRYTDATDGADVLELTLDDPTLWLVDSKIFAEGNVVDLFLGYGHVNRFVGRVLIWEPPRASAPRNGRPSTTVIGHSATRWLMESSKKKKGRRIGSAETRTSAANREADQETVGIIAWDYGFKAQADRTQQKRKAIKRKGKSDWQLLKDMARLNGFRVWCEWIPENLAGQWNLCFLKPGNQPRRPRDLRPGQYEFFWGVDETTQNNRLLDWSASFSTQAGASEVEVLRYDRKTYSYARYIARLEQKGRSHLFYGPKGNELSKEEITTGSRVLFTAFGRQLHVIRDRPFANDAEALEYARSWLGRNSLSFIHLQGTVPGLPDLRKYTKQKITGVPARLAGEYEFFDIVHELNEGSGYTCRFSARRAEDIGLDMSAFRV